MHGKCQNCGQINYLTDYTINNKHVCPNCQREFQIGDAELNKLKQNAVEKEKLRQAFGKVGVIEENS